jgi:D-alanyl-D-alanine carboxypeptidase (penicillin-binding protein 5/6)
VFGQADEVPLTVDKDLLVTLPLAAKKDIKVSVNYQSPLKAPIKKGQEVGKVHIELPNGMPAVDQPLIAAEGVEKLGFFQMALAKAKLLIAGKHSTGT